MKKENFNCLGFHDELIKLLNKYNYEISGSGYDDGSIHIEDKGNCNFYILKDSHSKYQICDADYKPIVDDYILSLIPENVLHPRTLNHVGIFTYDQLKAEEVFKEIVRHEKENIEMFHNTKDQKRITMKDGRVYRWISLLYSAKGYRFDGAYIDREIPLDLISTVVIPICCYCVRKNVRVI